MDAFLKTPRASRRVLRVENSSYRASIMANPIMAPLRWNCFGTERNFIKVVAVAAIQQAAIVSSTSVENVPLTGGGNFVGEPSSSVALVTIRSTAFTISPSSLCGHFRR